MSRADSTAEPRAPRSAPRSALVSWALYDWGDSAYWTVVHTFIFAPYFTQQVAVDEDSGSRLWGTALGAAGLIVAVGAPLLGAVADQTGRRKPWIAVFTALSIASVALLWFVEPDPEFVWPAMLLVGLGTIGFEFALVFYNAMLPALVPESRVGRWSGWGWSLGYAGGLASLLLAGAMFMLPERPPFGLDPDRAEHIRATALLVAAWYLVFALPLFLVTPDVPATGASWPRAVRDGWSQLAGVFREVRRYRQIVRFLIAKMLYVNGLVTLFAFGGIYAAGSFGMAPEEIVVFGVALNVAAIVGAAAFAWVDDRIGGKRTIVTTLTGLAVSLIVILLTDSRPVFWTFGLLAGTFVGPVQASSRSFLARASPEALRNQMFGLYALAGKATAFLGPLAVGWTTEWTGSQRLGMSTILAFLLSGLALMVGVKEPSRG